jgi:hypothetical protein
MRLTLALSWGPATCASKNPDQVSWTVQVAGTPNVASTIHSHQESGVALFSLGDYNAMISGNYPKIASHSVLGYKWPMANQVLGELGLKLDATVVKTVVDQRSAASLSGLTATITFSGARITF